MPRSRALYKEKKKSWRREERAELGGREGRVEEVMRSECARNKQYNSTKVGRLRPGVANELGYICVIGGMKVGNTCAGGEKKAGRSAERRSRGSSAYARELN